MKLILAIVQDKDSNLLSSQVIDDWWIFKSRQHHFYYRCR